MTLKHPRYQDYVIKDGRLVGEFEEMYRDHGDPWVQSMELAASSEKIVGLHLLERLRERFGCGRVLELGCGHGHFAEAIRARGFDVVGIDISPTAVAQAKARYPGLDVRAGSLADHGMIREIAPDVIVMAEITWYVLQDLAVWKDFLSRQLPDAFLLHMLSMYPPGEQKYGRDYFTTLDELTLWFDMTYLERGAVFRGDGLTRTWFLGCQAPASLARWNEGL